ncbi:MAG: hypothetical protein M0Z31_06565 [Clostridia bacterium]|nr:hypothetical protein [Clostridia bacterium]
MAFGVIVQLILEDKPKQEIEELVGFLSDLELPVTLSQLGIVENQSEKIIKIAKRVCVSSERVHNLSFPVDRALVARALLKAERLGQVKVSKVSA